MSSKRKLRVQAEIDAEPDGKKARLQRMMNVGTTSNKALEKILQEAGLQVAKDHDTVDVGQARFHVLSKSLQLPGVDGRLVDWEFCDPGLLVSRVVSESVALKRLFAAALQRSPCSHSRPWNLLIGWDEYVPGNKLKTENSRKCMNLVFSFVELGTALHMDVAWFTPVCVRRCLIDDVAGGWSAMLRQFLEHLLFSPGGFYNDAGVALDLGDGIVAQLFARPSRLLSDGDGLKIGLQWMGASATKPCWRHHNVLKKGIGLAEHNVNYVDIACGDPGLFQAWSEEDFRSAIDELVDSRQGNITQAALLLRQQAVGFKPCERGVWRPQNSGPRSHGRACCASTGSTSSCPTA